MTNKVQVVRYIRDYIQTDPFFGADEVDNMKGITVVYDIDYDERTVEASWSVCAGTNFSKALGQAYARRNAQKFAFPLEMVHSQAGLNHALLRAIGATGLAETYKWDDYISEFDNVRIILNRQNQIMKG